MDSNEFRIHVKLISDYLKLPHVKIFLWHSPYNKTQRRLIDSVCYETERIIGQLEQAKDSATREKQHQEILRIIEAHNEPLIYGHVKIPSDEIQIVILGVQKPK